MKILTLGKGFVSDHLPYEKYAGRINNLEVISEILSYYKPDVVINCIGKTGRPNIDSCENEKEITSFTNTALPIMLADGCKKHGVHLIQIGSGCIYFGLSPHATNQLLPHPNGTFFDEVDDTPRKPTWVDSGWQESDFANPKSFYSKTKYACDLVLGSMSHVSTLRIRMPVSSRNEPRNFINKVRNYSKVIDIPNSMTLMDDLVNCIDWFTQTRLSGIYHVVNPEPLSAAQVMREFQKYQPDHHFEVIDESELDKLTVAKRSNCILNSDKLKNAGFNMTPSQEGLERCMASYIKNL